MLYDQNAAEKNEDFLKFWTDSIDWDYCCNRVIDTDVLRQMIAKERKMLDELEKVICQVESKRKYNMLLILKKLFEIIGIILILIFVGFFGIGSAIFMFLDKNKEDSDDSEIED